MSSWHELADGVKVGVAEALLLVLKHLAVPFAAHPDYRKEE